MHFDPYDSPDDFRPIKPRPQWWTPAISLVLSGVLAVPVFFTPASTTRDLYIMGFMLCVVIFALYRIIFSTLFGESAAKREFRLPRTKRRHPQNNTRPRKRERIKHADGTWLEVVDDVGEEPLTLTASVEETSKTSQHD